MREELFTPGAFFSVINGNPSGKFLRSLATIGQLISQSPTLWRACENAAQETRDLLPPGHRAGNRGNGELFEQCLQDALTAEVQKGIAEDVIQNLTEFESAPWWAFNPLEGITWETIRGSRAPADFQLFLRFNLATLAVPLNLKRSKASNTTEDAAAVSTLLRLAQGRPLSDTRRLNVAKTVLRWWAGKEKIKPAEYIILTVLGDNAAGTVTGIEAQGLFSASAPGGGLTISRHATREVAQYRAADGVIPDDFDVNAAFAQAVTPKTSSDDLKLSVLSWLIQARGWAPSTARSYARTLEQMDDAELAGALVSVLRDVGGRARTVPDSQG